MKSISNNGKIQRNLEIINRLASHGHNITVMSADSDANPPANVTYLRLDQLYSDLREEFRKSIFNYSANIGSFKQPISYHNACFEMCKSNLRASLYMESPLIKEIN